jgi:hypothetical protein
MLAWCPFGLLTGTRFVFWCLLSSFKGSRAPVYFVISYVTHQMNMDVCLDGIKIAVDRRAEIDGVWTAPDCLACGGSAMS